jgi:hypothetical protein
MTEPTPSPSPEAPKKKLSPWAWFAIGCGILLLLFLGTCAVGTWWVGRKIKSFAESPDAALVKMAEISLRQQKDVEVISSDPQKGRITVRDKKTGREVTFNLEDIKAGRLSIESGKETATLTFGQNGPEGGMGEGEDSSSGSKPVELPEWIPKYPKGTIEGFFTASTAKEQTGGFSLITSDEAEKVLDFFEGELRARGFQVQRASLQFGVNFGSLTAEQGDRHVTLVLSREGDTTKGVVEFRGQKNP